MTAFQSFLSFMLRDQKTKRISILARVTDSHGDTEFFLLNTDKDSVMFGVQGIY